MGERWYYWLRATEPDSGRPYLIYGGLTEDEARQKGLEMLGGIDFKIDKLRTRNLALASSQVKGGKLERTHSLKKASERLGHTKSLKRMKQKRRTNGISDSW